jgi:type IV secretory pathway protease TraF
LDTTIEAQLSEITQLFLGQPLSGGEFFALNADISTSLDGRYFGPLPLSSVIGRAIPVWTVNER